MMETPAPCLATNMCCPAYVLHGDRGIDALPDQAIALRDPCPRCAVLIREVRGRPAPSSSTSTTAVSSAGPGSVPRQPHPQQAP